MTFITRIHFQTTAEPKPTVRFSVMATATPFWELGSRREAKGFFLATGERGGETGGGGDAEEFDGRD